MPELAIMIILLVTEDFFKRLKWLRIGNATFGYVHTPLSLMIDCTGDKHIPIKKAPLPPPPKFIWDPSRKIEFKDLVFKKFDELNLITNNLHDHNCSKEETGGLIKEFSDILFECSKQCFKLTMKSRPRKKPKSKP